MSPKGHLVPKKAVQPLAKPRGQEFASLKDDANVYKLVGPILLKQDKTEAVLAVDGRLEFIEKEM